MQPGAWNVLMGNKCRTGRKADLGNRIRPILQSTFRIKLRFLANR